MKLILVSLLDFVKQVKSFFIVFSDICLISFQEMFVTLLMIAKMDGSAKDFSLKILDFVSKVENLVY